MESKKGNIQYNIPHFLLAKGMSIVFGMTQKKIINKADDDDSYLRWAPAPKQNDAKCCLVIVKHTQEFTKLITKLYRFNNDYD